jgi:hypothetical protein
VRLRGSNYGLQLGFPLMPEAIADPKAKSA